MNVIYLLQRLFVLQFNTPRIIYDISYDVTDIFVILDRYLTGGDGDGLVLMDWYEIEVGQRTAGNNHQYYIKIRFIFTLNAFNSRVPFRHFLSGSTQLLCVKIDQIVKRVLTACI